MHLSMPYARIPAGEKPAAPKSIEKVTGEHEQWALRGLLEKHWDDHEWAPDGLPVEEDVECKLCNRLRPGCGGRCFREHCPSVRGDAAVRRRTFEYFSNV